MFDRVLNMPYTGLHDITSLHNLQWLRIFLSVKFIKQALETNCFWRKFYEHVCKSTQTLNKIHKKALFFVVNKVFCSAFYYIQILYYIEYAILLALEAYLGPIQVSMIESFCEYSELYLAANCYSKYLCLVVS